ncbi:IncF plasmid conjugative transfer pilus assembly protein TraH [uncultured Gammaproteobacteria bacterium]|uniref:Uncharacterized protein n=1 Tax=Bathymodiolus azoricus thioautotrophic gill symbiont TaxID=235205 RepID=A0ACA8ZQV4_9GAMM|nr:conjugal transfer protein TraH [Bathymodiolus azoricus thioautotrophic gill symbiont]CAB5500004.1 hypothetical protein AZO1586R_1026 [Bathymodiolus azoricus thioautotrophic gill symbiont]CAC9522965.1 IncF plasmid conjugative transfer pilus assembly protein TraH [uncultured Gammaproteobacteria bacterium]
MNILNNIFSKKYFKSILKKYFFELFTLTGFVVISLFMLSGQVKASWMDDWVSQSSSSGPSYFEGQKRGYANGGSFSLRYRNSKEYLFSIQKPRLKSGCGGIDLFLGGVSFMDPEYLMQKLQGAIQAAPAIAFDLALKTMAPEISDSIKAFEKIINELNGMQISECSIAKKIATGTHLDKGFGEILSLFDSKESAKDATSKNFVNSKEQQKNNQNKPTKEQKKSVEGCSDTFKRVFTQNGSVLEHIADTKGLSQYADYMRAYLGDVIINYADNQYSNKPVEACANQDVTKIDDIVTGSAIIRPVDGSDCKPSGDVALLKVVADRMRSIATKIKNKASLTTDETKFLNSIPFDIFASLNYAVITDTQEVLIDNFKDIIARAMAYAMVDDLVSNINELIRVAKSQSSQANDGASILTCEVSIITPLLDKVVALNTRALELQKAIREARYELSKEVNNNMEFNRNMSRDVKNK